MVPSSVVVMGVSGEAVLTFDIHLRPDEIADLAATRLKNCNKETPL